MQPFNTTQKLTAPGLKILPNKNGREALFLVKTSTGKTHDIYFQTISLNRVRNVKIPKLELGEPRDNLWVALVLQLKEMEQHIYLIPSKALATPDNFIFIDNDMGQKRFGHLSNWEIKVFARGMEKLSQYAFEYQLKHFV